MMKKNLLLSLFLLLGVYAKAQDLTLVVPDGLTEPYEVASGTEITVQWSYFEEEPTYMFSHNEYPGDNLNNDWQFSTNPDWTSLSSWTDNGDGTFDLNITITEETWIFGAYNSFSGNTYSTIIHVAIASSVVLSPEDGFICASGDTETLSLANTYDTYEWYLNAELIDGETASTLDATEAGSYYVIVNSATDSVQSNSVIIEEYTIDFTGMLTMDATQITLTADTGFDSYQWYSGPDAGSMTMISGATADTYLADVTSTIVLYSVEGMIGSCTVMSIEKSVSEDIFAPAVIMVNADTNSYNQICDGTQITLSVDESVENGVWYRDGNDLGNSNSTYTIYGAWQEGEYYLITSPSEWPGIDLQSNSVDVNYLELISPLLAGVDNYSTHCDGDEINVTLSDEGYIYTWYQHEEYNYEETDLIDVPTNTYTFTFSEATRITVVGEFQGCEESSSLVLNSYADNNPYIGISNYDQQYLCIDSTANLGINYGEEDYTDFQWYQKNGANWDEISGENTHLYQASEPGFYRLNATSAFCSTAIVESNEYEVKDYLDRPMYLWADQTEICIGDTATITFSDYNWTALQWHEAEMNIGSGGYEKSYVPIIGAGNGNTVGVTEFNSYIIKAKHTSCPNGLKPSSDPIVIRPAVNPTISLDHDVNQWKEMLWDSAAFYLFCADYPVEMSVEDVYDSYQWYESLYAGIDDYEWGDAIDGATTNELTSAAQTQWITLEVELDGCVGQSDPILLDTWAFLSPTITSYNNSELCQEGDSALIHISFANTWVTIEWYLDGVLIEGANDDSLYVFEEGMYTVTGYPEACPDFGYSSGVGPVFSFLEAYILEGEWEDTGEQFFYALPELGYYTYQWYIDGEAYENNTSTPWILYKEGLPAGVITVEVTNPEPCTSLSEGIVWDPVTSIEESNLANISIYPNPSNGLFNIEGLDPENTNTIAVYNTLGEQILIRSVQNENVKIEMDEYPDGLYLLQLMNADGSINIYKLTKH